MIPLAAAALCVYSVAAAAIRRPLQQMRYAEAPLLFSLEAAAAIQHRVQQDGHRNKEEHCHFSKGKLVVYLVGDISVRNANQDNC